MASQPVDFVTGLGALPDPQKAFRDAATDRIGLQRAGLQNQLLQQEFQKQQTANEEASRYQNDVAAALANPTARSYADLFAKHPQFKDAISKSWETRDAAAKQGDLRDFGSIHMALRSNKPELAAATLERRIAAEKAAGIDTSEDEQILTAIKSGDQSQLAAAKGLTGATLAAIVGEEQYAKALGEIDKGGEAFTLAPGSRRYSADGKLIAESPFAPQYRSVGEGDTLVEVGGGDPASSGPTVGGVPVTADTPFSSVAERIRNHEGPAAIGGYDALAYNTPNGRNAAGLSPVALTKMTIGQVYDYQKGPMRAATKGQRGPNDIGSTGVGAYQFESGTLAQNAAATFGKNWRDQPFTPENQDRIAEKLWNTVRGDPVKLRNTWAAFNGQQGTSGARVVAQGAPKAKPEMEAVDAATVEFYAQKVAAGGDLPAIGAGKSATAWRQAILKRSAQIQTGQGISGGESNLAKADVKANTSALLQAQKQYTSTVGFEETFQRNLQEVDKLGPKGVGGSVPVFNRWIQSGRKNVQGDPAVSAFNVAVNTAANEYAKLASGASGGAVTSDSARHEAMEILNTAQTWPQMQAAIKQMRIDGHNRVLALDTQIKRLRGNISGAGRKAPAVPKPGSVVKGYRFKGGNPASPASWVKVA